MYTKQTPALQHDTIIKQVIPSEHLFYQIYKKKMAEIYKDLITIADYFLNQEEKIASSSFLLLFQI